jgi:prevent-host-death family protein
MVETVNVYEAKAQLSKLLQRVAMGEEIVIARAGKPVARLVPEHAEPNQRPPRKSGGWRGRVHLAEDWDSNETNTAIAAAFGSGPG